MKGDEGEKKKTRFSIELEGWSESFVSHDLAMRLSKPSDSERANLENATLTSFSQDCKVN